MGVFFPGSCPEAPPSDFVVPGAIYYFLQSVPLSTSDTASYIFIDLKTGDATVSFHTSSAKFIRIIELDYSWADGYSELDSRIVSLSNSSISIETEYIHRFTKEKLCSRPISEEFRLWFEDEIAIFWTCIDHTEEKRRDEGLVIAKFAQTAVKEANVKLIAEKYVSDELIKLINFPNFNKSSTNDAPKCPAIVRVPINIYYVVAVVTLVLFTFVLFLKLYL